MSGERIYQSFSDADLVKLVASGDHAAYTQLFERYWAVLLQHAVKLLKDEDEALDVVQSIFTALWVKRNGIKISSSVKSYLYSAVRNRIISKIRHNKVHEGYLHSLVDLEEKGDFVTDNQVRFKELTSQLEMEVSKLPPRQQEVFKLSRNQGLSHAQIAEALSISDETVKKQINKALKVLKVKLEAYLLVLF
ncbi:RNA polymerase sigma-70 factor [Pedobacter metabolipauper]|uniref:RNA polymerase sigma-70 factor (Family 1) n=1 Tax=Pedobacter metabolipauper TaxID=425513 RepID=A0A4R6SSH7_9SPHI|nr:RNA polymerase sigma-70 factor [Pedobacter metabolipauper]TDQ07498.1 RNA polymerase sigma-70 factor (family 1) [Pedobacter metabolipauper]